MFNLNAGRLSVEKSSELLAKAFSSSGGARAKPIKGLRGCGRRQWISSSQLSFLNGDLDG